MSVLALSLGLSTVLILTALLTQLHTYKETYTHPLHPYTTVSVDSVAKGRVVISATNSNYPRTNTQSPNLDVSKFNASIPPEKLHPWPYESRQHIALHNSPKFKEPYPHQAGRIVMQPTHDRQQFNGLVVEFQFGHISRPLDQILVRESNPGRCRQIRVLYLLRYDPAQITSVRMVQY